MKAIIVSFLPCGEKGYTDAVMNMDIAQIQHKIIAEDADAWILLDYESHNPTVKKLLGDKFLTRKIILAIPASGKPKIIAHVIDTIFLEDCSDRFEIHPYKTWERMLELEKELFSSYGKVLMDISENGLLPRVSLADYGSVAFIKSLGIEVASSADVLQGLTATLTDSQYASQVDACQKALKIKDEAFALIAKHVKEKGSSDEYEIQRFICRRFHEEGMVFDEPPIVAIGPNAANPHYTPNESTSSTIEKGDLVLIDMWAKNKEPGSVYADITWMGYVGKTVPKKYVDRFAIIKAARDGVISFLTTELPKRKVASYEADDVARKIITDAGFGEYFVHRVGHSITADVSPHGAGANLDNYESHDTRHFLNNTSFSDEPGIYTEEFGMRTETDLHIREGKLVVVGGLQDEIIPILA
ncbi:MAG: M24 family metallopeptidase [Candidatus Enteromonas sp.]|nr:M24 family metallopeptidase [Candidatus Enteromonas sp.]